MYAFLVPVTVLLSAVFAVSAVGKLRSSDHGASAFSALRLPVPNARAAALALVIVEALVAGGLVVSDGPIFVGFTLAAAVLTAAMLVAVVRAHRLGATDDCGCFGDWMPSAIGPRLIARNVLLLVTALLAFLAAGSGWALSGVSVGLPRAFASATGALTAASALLAAALIAAVVWTMSRASSTAQRDTALPRGAGAVVLAESGRIVDLLAPGPRARVIVFVTEGCHACHDALRAIEEAGETLGGVVDVYVAQRASEGAVDASPPHELPSGARFVIDVGGSLADSLAIGPGTPVAALVGTDGRQAGPLAVGSAEVHELVASILALAEAPTA